MRTGKVAESGDEFVNVLYYGPGGTGKTTDLASLARLGRCLYIDAENGLKRRPLEELGIPVENIETLEWDGPLTYEPLEDAFWTIKGELEDEPGSWIGVLFDSGTEIHQSLLGEAVETRVQKATKLSRNRGSRISPLMLDPFFIDQDDYGEAAQKVRRLMRWLRDLPCHFGSAFLERRDQDKNTKQVHIGPAVSPSLQGDMVGWHDLVARTSYDDERFLGTLRPEGVAEGKDRFGVTPPLLLSPTMDRLVAYVHGDITPDTDDIQRSFIGRTREEAEQDQDDETQDEDGTEDNPDDGKPAVVTGRSKPVRRSARPRTRAGARR